VGLVVARSFEEYRYSCAEGADGYYNLHHVGGGGSYEAYALAVEEEDCGEEVF